MMPVERLDYRMKCPECGLWKQVCKYGDGLVRFTNHGVLIPQTFGEQFVKCDGAPKRLGHKKPIKG